MGWIRERWRRFLARIHWDDALVCEMSCGERDYHDHHDTEDEMPDHFVQLVCKRCGKGFWL